MVERTAARTLIGRTVTMDEIIGASLFLLENGGVNGINLVIDGGWRRAMTEPRGAVVGLGKMGEAIAERILDAGYPLAVFNRTAARAEPLAERGATVLALRRTRSRGGHLRDARSPTTAPSRPCCSARTGFSPARDRAPRWSR